MNKVLRILVIISTIIIGAVILGSSIVSAYDVGFDNLTIVKMISIFFGALLIIAGCVAGLILKKKEVSK